MARTKIVVLDRSRFLAECIRLFCRKRIRQVDVEHIAKASSALPYCKANQPSVVIFTNLWPRFDDGAKAISSIREASPASKFLMLWYECSPLYAMRLTGLDVDADLHIFRSVEDFERVLKSVIAGSGERGAISAKIKSIKSLTSRPELILTEREAVLIGEFGTGHSNVDIARRSGRKASTVNNQRRTIMQKLNLHSTSDLMAFALRYGYTLVDFTADKLVPAESQSFSKHSEVLREKAARVRRFQQREIEVLSRSYLRLKK